MVNAQVSASVTTNGLQGRTCEFPHPDLTNVRIADRAYSHGKRICTDDWVQRGDELGQVVACAEEHGELYIIVIVASVVRSVSMRGRVCRVGGGVRSLWSFADSHAVAAWRPTSTVGEVHVMMQ